MDERNTWKLAQYHEEIIPSSATTPTEKEIGDWGATHKANRVKMNRGRSG